MENFCILCKQHVDKVDIIGSFGCQQLPAYFLIKFDIIFDALFPLLLLLAFFFFFFHPTILATQNNKAIMFILSLNFW